MGKDGIDISIALGKLAGVKILLLLAACTIVATGAGAATLDDLKKLEITCFVPAWLPEGLHLTDVAITDDAAGPDAEAGRHFPIYNLVYDDGHGRTFSIDSAWEGIGDRNIMAEENTEETSFKAPVGEIFIIYRPAGKEGRKAAIQSNWVSDDAMQSETKEKGSKPFLGRYHGFSAEGMTVAEFERVVKSLHPVKETKPVGPGPKPDPPLNIHPKVFNLIDCWLSDSEAPVVTEINLDAVEKDDNEFQHDLMKQEGEWTRCPTPETDGGFMRYRVVEHKGGRYKAEYQENGGGSLTTSSTIEFAIDKRQVMRNGKPVTVRVLRVLGYERKP